MKHFFLLSFFLYLGLFSCSRQPQWQQLFDGKTLDGWVQRGGEAKYEARDGVIIGTTVLNTPNSFLCTEKRYENFILEMELKVDTALNSGIQIRSNSYPNYRNGRVHGYQVEVDPSPRSYSGGIYDEARRAWLYDLSENEPARKAFKNNQWNHYRIEAIDDTITTWVNGVQAAHIIDGMTASGFIGLQVHATRSERPLQVMWRDIRLKDLGAHAVKPFEIKRGTNISHWLSQSSRRGEQRAAFFTRDDVAWLKEQGFDHLRIPVDEEQLWHETGRMDSTAFKLLNNALDWCAAYNLKAIVDLHILRSHHFNEEEKPLWTDPKAQEQFINCWRDISSQLHARPVSMVAYELMNEPVAEDPEEWNRLIEKAYKVLRQLEPERVLVFGSNRWQSVSTFDSLRVPENDKHILLSFHFYEPFLLTHHQASWTDIKDYDGPVYYPGVSVPEEEMKRLPADLQEKLQVHNKEFNQNIMIKMLSQPLAKAKKYGLPLYCGEWGCYPTTPDSTRMQWYRDLRAVFDVCGIAWATWDYKGGFGIRDREGKPVENLITVLLKE